MLILLVGVVLYVYRRVGQDKAKFTWSEPFDPVPPAGVAGD